MLLPEILGSLLPVGFIYFALRFWLFKSGWVAAPATALCVVLTMGTLRALGGADGGAADFVEGWVFMAVPTAIPFAIDLIGLRGRAIRRGDGRVEPRDDDQSSPPS
jgi:hypothetical protein